MTVVDKAKLKALSHICFILGFASIVGSILIWWITKDPDPAHGERFGIFVGLWVPSFFSLSTRLDRYAEKLDK
jgi:hypothetical protein